ncbi:MAG: DUF883 domain-containing protein [Phycisphaeraceae bacterium]|nr:DUF883 domain-containing protein [Phycisphaeraceae bacterium]
MKRHANDGFSDSIEKLGDDVSRIKDDLAETAHDVAEAAASGVSVAKRQVNDTIKTARKQGRDAAKSLAEQIEEKPWTSVAIAAGAGVLLGILLCRKG